MQTNRTFVFLGAFLGMLPTLNDGCCQSLSPAQDDRIALVDSAVCAPRDPLAHICRKYS